MFRQLACTRLRGLVLAALLPALLAGCAETDRDTATAADIIALSEAPEIAADADAARKRGLFAAFLAPRTRDRTGPARVGHAAARLTVGGVEIVAPEGFCLDRQSLHPRRAPRFVLAAPCNRLRAGGDAGPRMPVVVTISVSHADDGGQLDAAAIRRTLGASRPGRVRRTTDGIFVVDLARGGQAAVRGAAPHHWRAFRIIGGNLVGLAVYAPEQSVFGGPAGGRVLLDFARALAPDGSGERAGLAPRATGRPVARAVSESAEKG